MKQLPNSVFRLLQLTLPRVSRGTLLYASQVLDVSFVSALRTAAKKEKMELQSDRTLTRNAFADGVAEIIKKHKLPVERKKFNEALKKDNVVLDEEFKNVAKKHIKDTSNFEAGDSFKTWLMTNRNVSPETGEIAKNYVNWVRAGDGGYKGALINSLSRAAASRSNIQGLDQDYLEAELASTYALETLRNTKQLEDSPFIGAYLGWIQNHLRLRGMAYSAPQHTRTKTTLDQPYNEGSGDDGDEEDTLGESLSESDSRNVRDLDMNDPEVKDMIGELAEFIKKTEPEHQEGLFILLDELLERRTWNVDKIARLIEDDPNYPALAKDIMQSKPGFDQAKWDAKNAHLNEEKRKEKFVINAREYVYKQLYPRLVDVAVKFFKQQDNVELKATIKRWVSEMNESKHKAELLAELKDVPLYEYQEGTYLAPVKEEKGHEFKRDEEGFLTTELKKKKKLIRKSSLSAQLLRRVVSVDDPELVVERLAGEDNALTVFERGEPRFAHVLCYETRGGQHFFDVPADADQEHIFEAVRACRSFLASVSVETA